MRLQQGRRNEAGAWFEARSRLARFEHLTMRVVEFALRAGRVLGGAAKEAARKGLFGAPSFVTGDGELFWGNDRLEQALAWAGNRPTGLEANSSLLMVRCSIYRQRR